MKFKPKLTEIIKEYGMSPIVIIPKNRGLVNDFVKSKIRELGVEIDFEDTDKQEYKVENITIYRYRGEDIPKIIEDFYFNKGIKILGITGDDLLDEYQLRNPNYIVENLETVDWYDEKAKFGRPALCLLIKKDIEKLQGKVNIAVNSKYEFTARSYLEEINDGSFEPSIHVYNGDSEKTVAQGLNDACIEIVYSGKSLEENRLKIAKTIRLSDLDVVGIDEKSPLFERNYKLRDAR